MLGRVNQVVSIWSFSGRHPKSNPWESASNPDHKQAKGSDMKRLAIALVGGVLGLGMALGGGVLAAAAPDRYDAAQVREDFDELYARMQASHYDLYARRSRQDYDTLFKSLRSTFKAPMTRLEIAARFQDFLAYGNVAHARIDFLGEPFRAYGAGGGRMFPLDVRVVKGAALVSANNSGVDAIAVGDEIVALDGEPTAVWLPRLRRHLSADTDYMAHAMLEWSLPRLIWLEHGALGQFQLKLRDANGRLYETVVPARTRPEIQAASQQQPAMFDLDWDQRTERMLDADVAYLRPGPFYNNDPAATDMWDNTAFAAFIDQAFDHFIQAGAKSLIIDLRNNEGGDNSFSDRMVGWFAVKPFRFASDFRIRLSQAAIDSNRQRLEKERQSGLLDPTSPRLEAAYAGHKSGETFSLDFPPGQPRQGARFQGKVFILINRHSYSNTVTVAALAQDYGFATILGEETSDLATTLWRNGTVPAEAYRHQRRLSEGLHHPPEWSGRGARGASGHRH